MQIINIQSLNSTIVVSDNNSAYPKANKWERMIKNAWTTLTFNFSDLIVHLGSIRSSQVFDVFWYVTCFE